MSVSRPASGRGRRPAATVALASSAALAMALILLAGFASGGCSSGPGAGGDADDRPLVVASVPIVYSLAANVAGDAVRLENLLPPGTSPHQVSFTPAQARLVSEADLVLVNGAGLDPWVDDLVAASGNHDVRVVTVTDNVGFLRPGEPIAPAGADSDDHAGEADEGVDPHVWLDASNARLMVAAITEALTALDPDEAAGFRARAASYDARLTALDEEIRAALAATRTKRFVSFHSAFLYYAGAYGLVQAAVIAESPGTEPSPQYLADLIGIVRDLRVTAVFSEPQFSPRAAESLAREAGVDVYEVDPEGSALSPSLYEDLMRANTATFVRALGGGVDD